MRAAVVLGLVAAMAAPGQAQGIAPETARGPLLGTPAVPAFELLVYEPGVLSPRALRRQDPVGSQVSVRGYVTAKTRTSFALAETRQGPGLVRVAGATAMKAGSFVTVTGGYGDGVIELGSLEAATGEATIEAIVNPQPAGMLTVPKPLPAPDAAQRNIAEADYAECVRLYGLAQYEEAGKRCGNATRLWAGHANAYYMGAAANVATQDWSAAAEFIEMGLRHHPSQPMFRMLAGLIYLNTGDLDAAEVELSLAVQLEPDLWRGHYYLSLVHAQRGFDGAAATALTTAISRGPRDALPYRTLVALYGRWGYDAEAVTVARLAVDVLPNDPAVRYDLGRALMRGGDDKAAIKAFTEHLKVAPNDPRGLYARGCVHARLKHTKQARSDLESFLVVATPAQQTEIEAASALLETLE